MRYRDFCILAAKKDLIERRLAKEYANLLYGKGMNITFEELKSNSEIMDDGSLVISAGKDILVLDLDKL